MSNDSIQVQVSDGCRIAVERRQRPGAPTLFLSNSLGTTRAMWRPQVEALADAFSLVLYDTRGHGESDAPQGAYSIDRLSLDVIEILDALALDKVLFCGLSLGGMIAQRLSWRAPERFGALVLAATSAYVGPVTAWQERIDTVLAHGMAAVADGAVSRWFTADFVAHSPQQVEEAKRALMATDPVGYAGCCGAIRDMDQRPTAPLNRLPTLIIAGNHDPATPVAHAEFLHAAMPDARLETLPAAHLINLEQPDAFTAIVRKFLPVDQGLA